MCALCLCVAAVLLFGEVGAEGIGRPAPERIRGWSLSPPREACSPEPAIACGHCCHGPVQQLGGNFRPYLVLAGIPASTFRTAVRLWMRPVVSGFRHRATVIVENAQLWNRPRCWVAIVRPSFAGRPARHRESQNATTCNPRERLPLFRQAASHCRIGQGCACPTSRSQDDPL